MSMKGFSILPGPLLARRTTMGLGGVALAEIRVEDPLRLDDLPDTLRGIGGRVETLGGGSNIIAGDGELPITLLTLGCKEIRVLGEDGGQVFVRAEGGARLPALLGALAKAGLSGLEGLAGIPGSVGGALAMNAGSYGVEVWSAVTSIQVFTREANTRERLPEAFEVGYRHCALKGLAPDERFLVTAATFALTPTDSVLVRERMRKCLEKKRVTQPVGARSAGCVFKNPPGASAGKLLDEAGMKGQAVGGMSYSSLHAAFMINSGRGTSAEALELLEMGREAVRRTHGIHLETEVRIWP